MHRSVVKKKWHDRRCVKLRDTHKKKAGMTSSKRRIYAYDSENRPPFIATAPTIFSFVKNTEETISYFTDIITQIDQRIFKQHFFIDSSRVEEVTADALIYILAILYNIKLNPLMKYTFKGNLPNNKLAAAVYRDSGFMNYVETKRPVMPRTDDKIQILSGKQMDPETAKLVCEFVMSQFNQPRLFTRDLYKALIELMANTFQHAYTNSKRSPYWYLYAINLGDRIQLTFIDTGEGIPSTVKKKFLERFPGVITDSGLIHSALRGESRTGTNLSNRGHGLPALYDFCKSGYLQNFYILSGKGCCIARDSNGAIDFEKYDYPNGISGTIFRFEIINK